MLFDKPPTFVEILRFLFGMRFLLRPALLHAGTNTHLLEHYVPVATQNKTHIHVYTEKAVCSEAACDDGR